MVVGLISILLRAIGLCRVVMFFLFIFLLFNLFRYNNFTNLSIIISTILFWLILRQTTIISTRVSATTISRGSTTSSKLLSSSLNFSAYLTNFSHNSNISFKYRFNTLSSVFSSMSKNILMKLF